MGCLTRGEVPSLPLLKALIAPGFPLFLGMR